MIVTKANGLVVDPRQYNKQAVYFPVLDKGFISLVDYMGDDSAIVQAARVSYGAGTETKSSDKGLLNYLMRHRHTTPYEMVEFKFHIGMPIFVARQWVRHRTASLNEYSGRYSLMPMLFYNPPQEQIRRQSGKNRQGRADLGVDSETAGWYNRGTEATREQAIGHYKNLCEADIARELARIDLPLSMYTYWYWKIDLHNLFHFLSLRCDSHAQWEIRVFADTIAAMIENIVPLAFNAWKEYRFNAISFSNKERHLLDAVIREFSPPHNIIEERYKDYGLSKREKEEFVNKFNLEQDDNFTRYIDEGKTPQYFESIIEGASHE